MAQARLSPGGQSHPCPSQPTLSHGNPETSHTARPGELTGPQAAALYPEWETPLPVQGQEVSGTPLPPNTPAWGSGWTQGQERWCKTGTVLCRGWCPQGHAWLPRLGLRDGASGWEPRAAAVQEGDRGRVQGPSASPAPALWCWAGRREGQEGSSKGTLVSDEGSPLAVGLIILTVRLRGTLLLPDVGGKPLVGDDPAVQGIHLHTPQAEA